MDALKQYIDLYRSHGNLVNSNSAPAMNDLRGKALETLENVALPAKGSENYETTDLASMLAPDYGVNIARVNIDVNPAATFHCGVPSLSTALFMLVNDIYAERENAREGLPEGVYVRSLRKFCLEHPDVAKEYYGKCAEIGNPIVALDTLLAQDGIAVWVLSLIHI